MGRSPPARRTAGGVLNRLVSPLLFAADDIVEAYRASGPGQDASGWVLSPLRVAGRYLRIMRDDDSSAQSGASTHSHASGDDALQLKRRQVSVTRCGTRTSDPGLYGGGVLHTHPPLALAGAPACGHVRLCQARALILRPPPAPQGGQFRPTGDGL